MIALNAFDYRLKKYISETRARMQGSLWPGCSRDQGSDARQSLARLLSVSEISLALSLCRSLLLSLALCYPLSPSLLLREAIRRDVLTPTVHASNTYSLDTDCEQVELLRVKVMPFVLIHLTEVMACGSDRIGSPIM